MWELFNYLKNKYHICIYSNNILCMSLIVLLYIRTFLKSWFLFLFMTPEMKFSNSQNMSINFCSVVLILCKNQQMEDSVLVLLVFMMSLHLYFSLKLKILKIIFLNCTLISNDITMHYNDLLYLYIFEIYF